MSPADIKARSSAGLPRHLQQFSDMLVVERGLSTNTVAAYMSDLKQFAQWIGQDAMHTSQRVDVVSGRHSPGKVRYGAVEPAELQALAHAQRGDIMAYLAERLAQRTSARSAARALSALRRFYAWQVRERHRTDDPTRDIDSPSLGRTLPRVPVESEVTALLEAPDVDTALGLRDRAMLEMVYSSGLRVSELIALTFDQINRRQGVLRIWGKGGKERLVPLGEQAAYWLHRYEQRARPELAQRATDSVFLSRRGTAMTRQNVWQRIRLHGQVAGWRGALSPHTLRHAFATHLVNHDADLRVVQLLLGHSSLSTTQIYTHVARERLQAMHREHHPRG